MPPTKTPDDDIESGQSQATTINEETPLLISQSDHRAGPDDDTVEEAEQDEGSRYTRSYFAWRIFWTVAAITVTVIFVKAWIDAGADVNVGCCIITFPSAFFFRKCLTCTDTNGPHL